MTKPLISVALFSSIFLLAINILAIAIANTERISINQHLPTYNQEFGITRAVPALVRWDSQWYWSIAARGYTSTAFNSVHNIAFLPLYPLALKIVSLLSGLNLFQAGLFTAWLFTVAGCVMVYRYTQVIPSFKNHSFSTVVALLAFPLAYIFTAMYSESLYLFLTAACLWLYHKQRPGAAAGVAVLASLTRINALALSVAFALGAIQKLRQRTLQLADLYPIGAPLVGLGVYSLYSYQLFDDPLRYLHEKVTWFTGQPVTWPWLTLQTSFERFLSLIANPQLELFASGFELVAIVLALGATILLWRRQLYVEAGYVAASCGIILIMGTTWGAGRYIAVLFPIFALLASTLEKHRWGWYAYLFISLLWQAILLWNYVALIPPAP